MSSFLGLLIRSVILTAGCLLIGVVFNWFNPNGIDLVARSEYEIFVPCPESQADAQSTTAAAVKTREVLYLDARPEEDFAREHIKGSENLPYPVLGDPPAERIEALKRKGIPIVTYGSGGRDRSGEMMADMLTELGIPQVTHLEGGIAAWKESGGETERTAEAGDE